MKQGRWRAGMFDVALAMLRQGKAVGEIAVKLEVSPGTAYHHLRPYIKKKATARQRR